MAGINSLAFPTLAQIPSSIPYQLALYCFFFFYYTSYLYRTAYKSLFQEKKLKSINFLHNQSHKPPASPFLFKINESTNQITQTQK